MQLSTTLFYSVDISTALIAIIRMSEPMVWQALRETFCCAKKKNSILYKKSLSSFLNSSVNVEYVYMILEGISSVLKHRE